MKFRSSAIVQAPEILYNDHYVAIPYDCYDIVPNAKGIIPAGTIVPYNNGEAIGVLLHDVDKTNTNNGTLVVHGFIAADKLPNKISNEAVKAMAGRISFINADGEFEYGEVSPT